MNENPEMQLNADQSEEIVPVPVEIILTPSSNRMELELMFRKAGEPSAEIVFEDVMNAIEQTGVVYGINEAAIKALCSNPFYNRPYVVAKGSFEGDGENGSVQYLIKETRTLKPKLREDGTVDYRDLGFTQNVALGDTLCEITPPTTGANGMDIYGTVLPGRTGKEAQGCAGKNTAYSEDGLKLVATCDGSAEVKRDGSVEIVDVLRINGNVDNSTGDLNFVGDIIVNGDVASGFNVISGRSITIKGNVGGAHIKARGDIFISEGINGMNRGVIEAGGSIKCKYMQSCTAKAMGDIYAETIMYSNIECAGNIELMGKRAALIGGKTAVAGTLKAKTIGTSSHVATHITMASTGVLKTQELQELEDRTRELIQDNRKLQQIVTRYEDLVTQGRADEQMGKTVIQVKQQLGWQTEERDRLINQQEEIRQDQLDASRENSFILCQDAINVGTQVTFGPLHMSVQVTYTNSRIMIIDKEIAVRPI